MSKKLAYSIMQVSWGEILISPEKSSKQIRFSDGSNDWANTNNFVLDIPDEMIGHVCVFAKCVVGGDLVVELGGNVPSDTGTEIYFTLFEGERANKYKSFIPRKNHTDFVLNFDSIKALIDSKADKTELNAKADKTELDAKADKTELDAKADKTELDAKADKTELDAKADKTELDAKANKSRVESFASQFNDNMSRLNTYLRREDDIYKGIRNDYSSGNYWYSRYNKLRDNAYYTWDLGKWYY